MLEGDWETGFGMKPAVRDNGDIVVRGYGLKHRHCESDVVVVFCVSLAKDEGVMEQDDLAVDVFDDDPERLRTSVDLLIPLEVGGDGELYPE